MSIQSQRRDSNPRPADYKSAALPTELRWRPCPVGERVASKGQSVAIRTQAARRNWGLFVAKKQESCRSIRSLVPGCPSAGPNGQQGLPLPPLAGRFRRSIGSLVGRQRHRRLMVNATAFRGVKVSQQVRIPSRARLGQASWACHSDCEWTPDQADSQECPGDGRE